MRDPLSGRRWWVALYRIHTAKMTGNTVGMGLRLGEGRREAGLARLLALAVLHWPVEKR